MIRIKRFLVCIIISCFYSCEYAVVQKLMLRKPYKLSRMISSSQNLNITNRIQNVSVSKNKNLIITCVAKNPTSYQLTEDNHIGHCS